MRPWQYPGIGRLLFGAALVAMAPLLTGAASSSSSPLLGLLLAASSILVLGTIIVMIVRDIMKRKTPRKIWVSGLASGIVIFAIFLALPMPEPSRKPTTVTTTNTTTTKTVTVTASPTPVVPAPKPPVTTPVATSVTASPKPVSPTQSVTALPNLTLNLVPKGWPSNPVVSRTKWSETDIPLSEPLDPLSNGFFVMAIYNDSPVDITQLINYAYYVDGKLWAELPGSPIPAHTYYWSREGMGPKPVGEHEIKVVLDPKNLIKESDESDNVLITKYYVGETLPPERTIEVSPAKPTVKPGGSIQFTARMLDSKGNVVPNQPFSWSINDIWGGMWGGSVSDIGSISSTGLLRVASGLTLHEFKVLAKSGQYTGATLVSVDVPPPPSGGGSGGAGGTESGYIDIYFSPSRFGDVAIYLDGSGPYWNHVYVNPASIGVHNATIIFSNGQRTTISGQVTAGGAWVVRQS